MAQRSWSVLSENTLYRSMSISVPSPDGKVFVHVTEDLQRKPIQININVAKAGTSTRAWADAISRLTTRLLANGVSITSIIEDLSEITTSAIAYDADRQVIRSCVEAIVIALLKYRSGKFEELVDELGVRKGMQDPGGRMRK